MFASKSVLPFRVTYILTGELVIKVFFDPRLILMIVVILAWYNPPCLCHASAHAWSSEGPVGLLEFIWNTLANRFCKTGPWVTRQIKTRLTVFAWWCTFEGNPPAGGQIWTWDQTFYTEQPCRGLWKLCRRDKRMRNNRSFQYFTMRVHKYK